ncbi:hypothetical protein [Streptomyces sp. HUAS TT7]|uniref:hypothetical protein n=1 Tax=Streptomyces sp. HUAS TT7 TaxID=3447507 RepID=UPI003F660B69
MSASTAAAVPNSADAGMNDAPVRTQRVKVPMRLVSSPFYADVALSVYVKVKALGARPEGCEAKAATIAAYVGLSKASVERGLTLLSRPAPDGVVELVSVRRTLPGGRGLSAVRRTRPVSRVEAFVWLPVAASEDLTPRQLRAYAVIAYAQQMGIALTEGELAGHLRHHSGRRAGQPLTAAAAGGVVDELEAAQWVTVQRRAGVQGRHRFVAHHIAPTAASTLDAPTSKAPAERHQDHSPESVEDQVEGSACPLVGEGSGLEVGEGSLANEESPRTDSPEDERALFSSAVGEVPVVAVESPAAATAHTRASGGLALRADEKNQPVPSTRNSERSSRSGGPAHVPYTGPQLSMSSRIYAILKPVHWLLARVNNPFLERQIAREVARQLAAGIEPERLHHRLTARFAMVFPSDIRDPGRWLLGVALPRWGCGHLDCEAGTLWSTGRQCPVCEEVVADRFAARQRERRIEQGLCPDHGQHLGRNGACPGCVPEGASPGQLPGTPRTRGERICRSCRTAIPQHVRIVIDGQCRGCWQRQTASPADDAVSADPYAAPVTQPGRRLGWRELVAQQNERCHGDRAAS